MTKLYEEENTIFIINCRKNNNGKKMIAFLVFQITFEMQCSFFFFFINRIVSPAFYSLFGSEYISASSRAFIRGKPCSHIHLHPGYASLGQGPQPNLSRSIRRELVYYFYVRNYEDRAVTTTPAQITKIYLGVNNIDCTFV